jgi:hypothetical protein
MGVVSRFVLVAVLATPALSVTGCIREPRAAVSMAFVRKPKTPADAIVTIDEEYVGPLGYVAARGVRLPVGTHRVTIEKEGYFPYDAIIVADRKPIKVEVKLTPVPD